MIAAYALIVYICLIAVANRFIFSSFTGEKFQGRFSEATEGMRGRMIQANREMDSRLGSRIGGEEEPDELIEFGEIWRKRLQVIKTLDVERKKMNGHIRFIYYILVFGLIHAALELVYPLPVFEAQGVKVYPNTIGWGFALFSGVLLVLYQMSYRKLDKALREVEVEFGEAPD
ncbi:hypothetical protein KAU18_03365 [Candidatus Bathyarchaeota archaeon]|nr:hypothetical protein [Candidatus Bathyarchaeota archaeon]